MTLQRKSPLPIGRYWQDIFAKQANDWNAWLSDALKSESVSIEKVEHFNPDPLHDGSWIPGAEPTVGDIKQRTWVLFNVLKPIDWPAVKLGFPTIAERGVQTSSDTVTNPPGPSPTEEVIDAAKQAADAFKPVLVAAGAMLAIYLFRREIFR